MPDTPEEDQAHSDQSSDLSSDLSSDQGPVAHRESQGLSRWAAPAALLVALVAVALAIWALVGGPSTGSSSTASSANATQPGDAKERVCGAFDIVSNAVALQTNLDLGPDKVALTAVAGNARLALFGGGQYLLNSLDSATPSQLADPMRTFAEDLQNIGMNALAGSANSDPEQIARMADGDQVRKQIVDLCK